MPDAPQQNGYPYELPPEDEVLKFRDWSHPDVLATMTNEEAVRASNEQAKLMARHLPADFDERRIAGKNPERFRLHEEDV